MTGQSAGSKQAQWSRELRARRKSGIPARKLVRHGKDPLHPEYPHATAGGYDQGCKCQPCRDAKNEAKRVRMGLKPGETRYNGTHFGDATHPNYPHGEYRGYQSGCRCEPCRKAKSTGSMTFARTRERADPQKRLDRLAKLSVYQKTDYQKARARQAQALKRARKRATLIPEQRPLLVAIYEACPTGYDVDHIVPMSKGGKHAAENLQYLPSLVNRQKHAKLDFDSTHFAIKWQDVLKSSTTIPQGSTAKRPEAQSTPN